MPDSLISKIHSCSANDSGSMVALYQQYLQQILGACGVSWSAAYRGEYGRKLWQTKLMNDWKVVDVIFPLGTTEVLAVEAKKYFKLAREQGDVDPQVSFCIEHAGESRVQRIGDAITTEEWQEHWMRELQSQNGVGERMVGVFTLSDESESIFLVDRAVDAEPFSAKDAQLFYDALVEFPRLHYWLFLERGLVKPAQRPFSPRDREVLSLLLGPMPKQDIANELGLAEGTVQNYVQDIYKNLGVSSRYELAQLWLQSVPNQ